MTDDSGEAESNCDRYLLAQIREAFGRVVYSHKTQEKQADISRRKHRLQQAALILLTALGSGTFLASVSGIFGTAQVTALVTSSVALLVSWISLGAKTFHFEEESNAHRDTGAQLWDVRESYISLIADLMAGEVTSSDARARRDALQEAAHHIYASAPRTADRARARARKGLKDNEEMTFTSREIDLFLPVDLRLGEGGQG